MFGKRRAWTTEPWKHQKSLKKEAYIPTQEEIINISNELNNRNKALFLLTYLTAGRISEVLQIEQDDFQVINRGDRNIMLIRLHNRKNRQRLFKDLPIPFDKEGHILKPVLTYAASKSGRLFTITKQRAWQIFRKVKMNPHWLRHIRLTHLVTVYDMNEELIKRFAGWTDSRPAKNYMELKWYDILQKM